MGVTAGPASPNKLVQTALVSMDNSVLNGTSTAAGDAIKVLRADIKPLTHGSDLTEGVTISATHVLALTTNFSARTNRGPAQPGLASFRSGAGGREKRVGESGHANQR